MIDHVSIAVRNLPKATDFYASLLSSIGYEKLVEKSGTVGFGKKYADFWLNHRPSMNLGEVNDGFHVCLRATSTEQVDKFYEKAIALGAESCGEPGLREEYDKSYYAAFVYDLDGNKIEVVTFVGR